MGLSASTGESCTPAGKASKRFGRAALAAAALLGPSAGMAEWPTVNGAENQRYSPLVQITTKNVSKLGAAALIEGIQGAASRTVPVIDGNMMFIDGGRYVYAIDIDAGKVVWRHDVGGSPARGGVAVGGGQVYVGVGGPGSADLVALNETTGAQVWAAPLSRPSGESTGSASGAPLYANGVVSIGTNGDFGYRGLIVAVDAKTGKEVWRFNTVPSPGEPGSETWPKDNHAWLHGGGAVWLDGVYDPAMDVQFYVLGNAVPQYAGETRPGDNLFTDSVVALDNKTGKPRWYYQMVHHDIWEADIAEAPVLFNAQVNGRVRKAIAAMRTDGYLFQLDRTTGKPLGVVEERPVAQDPQQKTAPTQPYPVGAQPVLPDCGYWKTQPLPAGFEVGCFFTAASVHKPNVLVPSYGMRSTPMAYDPQTHYFYATGNAGLQWFRRAQDPDFYTLALSSKVPGIAKASYGVLAAIDAGTGKIAWQKKFQNGRPTGAMATAGGLVFQNAGDGNLQAYDAKTGALLWQFQTGVPSGSPPFAFEHKGDEYIASVIGNSIWLFKLGGTLPQRPARPASPQEQFTGPIVDKSAIETSLAVNDMGLSGPHVIQDEYEFDPFRARVKAGTRVTWRNNGLLPHTIIALDGTWSTQTLDPLDIGYHVFDRPGTYIYHVKEYPWQYGEITVVPADQGPPAGK